MISFGDGERTLVFDIQEHRYCERCEHEQAFSMRLKYRYGHLYNLFGWVIHREYQLACPTCTHGWVLDRAGAEERLGRDPIPFHQRNGWLVGIVLIHVVAVAAVLQPGGIQ
ncbi:MAG: hypothetical protein M3Q40_04640 [Pseudomonadota bacterium]|nr:hypothetical protein [Pseudomonadota bacterium]